MSDMLIQSDSIAGEIKAEGAMAGTITPEATLEGAVSMPKEKEVVKLANAPKISEVTLSAAAWGGEGEKWHSQVVTCKDFTEKCQVDLTPSLQQLEIFYEKDLTFLTRNKGGVVTAFAIGQKPLNDYTIQVTLTEVDVPDGAEIWGVTVGTPMNPDIIAARVEIDGELSQMSNNAVQNKAVAAKFAEVETTIGNIDVLLGTI